MKKITLRGRRTGPSFDVEPVPWRDPDFFVFLYQVECGQAETPYGMEIALWHFADGAVYLIDWSGDGENETPVAYEIPSCLARLMDFKYREGRESAKEEIRVALGLTS